MKPCLHLHGQSISGAFQRNLLFQLDNGSTCKSALTSCKTSLPPPLSRPTVHTFLQLLDFAHSVKGKTTTFTSSTSSSWILRGLRFHGTTAHWPDLLATMPRLLARRQHHNAPSLHRGWTILQIVTQEYRILEVLNYELTTPTPAARIEVFESRLSLFGTNNNSSSRIGCTFRVRHPPCSQTLRISLYSELQSQSSRSVCLVHLRRPLGVYGTDCSQLALSQLRAPLLWLCATQHSSSVLCILPPARTENVPFTFSLFGCSTSPTHTIHSTRLHRCQDKKKQLQWETLEQEPRRLSQWQLRRRKSLRGTPHNVISMGMDWWMGAQHAHSIGTHMLTKHHSTSVCSHLPLPEQHLLLRPVFSQFAQVLSYSA